MKNDYISRTLMEAGVPHEVFWTKNSYTIYISGAGQLFASKKCFDTSSFKKEKSYGGWEAHHVVEDNHVEMMGWRRRFPAYEDCLCVLLPPGAHRGRFNRIIRSVGAGGVGKDVKIDDQSFVEGYLEAYRGLGAYTGSSESRIIDELMSIVKAAVKKGSS